MEKKWKKIGGFIFLIVIILLVLQIISKINCGNKVIVGESTSFAPDDKKPIDKKQEEQPKTPAQEENKAKPDKNIDKNTDKNPDKQQDIVKQQKEQNDKKDDAPKQEPKKETKAEEKTNDEEKLDDQSKQASNESQPDNTQALQHKSEQVADSANTLSKNKLEPKSKPIENKQDDKSLNQQEDQIVKPITGKKSLDAVYVSDQDFRAIDDIQEKVKESVRGEKEPSKYRWAIVSSYEEPDKAVQILGGVPFAIDSKNKLYYRIFPEKNKMHSVMLGRTYGRNGIPAHDPQFPKIATDAAYKGMITSPPDTLEYIYLFTFDRALYINGKVISAFEWFIKNAEYNDEQAEAFRKDSMVCFAVWHVFRDGSKGETGSIIPVYFESSNGQKQFLPQEYYQADSEANKLGIKEIDKKEYM